MSDNDNVWNRPKAPPPPLFTGKKEKDLAKQVSDELSERIVKSSVVYYPISVKHSNFHSLYGEAVDKNFLPPVKIDAYVEWDGEETATDSYGLDKKSSITIHFQKRRLTEDKNLFVREGDFVLYGEHQYEIIKLQQPRPMFGQIDSQIEIVAKCVRARAGLFPEQKTADDDDDPRLTQPAYDPVNELDIVETTGDVNGAICKDDQESHARYATEGNPPPPLFAGKKEKDLSKQITDEVLERVVGQQVVYFPVSIKHSNYHDLYGESVDKTFLPPIRVFAAVEWLGSDTETTYLGLDKTSKISVKFHKKRLTEDQNLFVREGDYILYGNILYEITILKSPRLMFGQIDSKHEIIAECIRARQGVFTLSKKKVPSGDEVDVTSLTACENASFIQKVEGEKNTAKNIGSGEGLYAKKVGSELRFKSLKAGDNVSITSNSSEITIGTTANIDGTITNALTASLALLANTASYVTGQNVSGAVALANTASYYVETDTLATVVARGNSTAATLSVAGISASANISASAFYGDGSNITGVTAEWDGSHTGNASITGKLTAGSLAVTNNLSASGHISASSFVGDGTNITGVTAEWDGSHTGNASITGTLTAGALAVTNNLSASGHISASSFIGDGSNITGVTAEWDGSHTGNASITGNLTVSNNLSASGHISASSFVGDGTNLTGITAEWDGSHTGNATIIGNLSASANISASAFYGEGKYLTGVKEWDGTLTGSAIINGSLTLGTNLSASGHVSASSFIGDGSNLTGITAEWDGSHTGNASISGTLTAGALSVTNSLTASAISVTNNLSASGHVSSSTYYGDGSNLTGITAEWDGSHTGNASITGTLTAGALSVTNNLSASGHVSASSFVGDGSSLTGVTAEWDGSHTGNASITGILTVSSNLSASGHVSASAYFGDGSNLTGISTASTLDEVTDNGSSTTNNITVANLVASGLTGSLTRLRNGNPYIVAGSNVTIATSSAGQISISSTGGGGGDGTIGSAEDGAYTDGLFTDFISSTAIGTAIDRFNEILKILAPSPSPDVSRLNATSSAGVSSKLSFGAANAVTGYNNVTAVGSFSAVNVTGTYESGTESNDFRKGTYNGTEHMEGIVNFHVTADTWDNGVNNYPVDSFGNAEAGFLKLYHNGNLLHSINLTSSAIGVGNPGTGSGNHVNGNGSGFINVSVTASAEDRSQNKFDIFKHRTADYRVHTAEHVNGFNYIQVKHSGSWGDKTTNYVQWVKDGDSNALAATNARFANETGLGSKYLSGVKYFTSASAKYLVEVSNAYKNVYTSQNISFTTTNCTISAQSFPELNTGAGEDETKVLQITGSATTSTTSLSGSIQSSVNVAHPLKSDLSGGGSASSTGLLIYNPTGNSTALRERFKEETYRLASGSYSAQANVDSGTWNSQTHMTGSGTHSDGLQFYNARLYSPLNTIQSGDFRDNSEGGPFGLSAAGNPNYSGETGTRTFFRYFRNSTGATKRDISLVINGSSTTIVPTGTALNSGRIRAFVKIPGTTGFMDVAQAFTYDNTTKGSGAYVLAFDNSVDATNYMSFGTKGIANGDDIVLKIEASTSWTGYVDDIQVAFGAGTGTAPSEAPALDDIDINDAGAGVKLSFGASKAIGGYTSVSTNTGNSAVDVNGSFLDSGDLAGAFDGTRVIDGELNEDVSSNGTSYVANSFKNAATGSLKLEVNGAVVHTIDLSDANVGVGNPGSGTDSELNGNSSGFVSLSTYKPGLYATNSMPDYTKLYRTGKYQVGAADQRNGWNYARVIHTGSGIGQSTTNYVEWVNDNDNNALAATAVSLSNFSGSSFYSLSGVRYFVACSASLTYAASNVYKNVYYRSSDGISFPTTTNCSVTHIGTFGNGLASTGTTSGATKALPSLSTTAGSQNHALQVTGTISFSSSTSLVGPHATTAHTASVSSRVKHPIKSNLTTSTLNKSSFLVFSGSENSDLNTNEYFDGEVYRLESGSYLTQNSVTNAGNAWDSTVSINDVGGNVTYSNGLLVYNDKLMSPITGGLYGDFRGVNDGGSLQAPSGNPNYTTLTTATRECYRYFRSNQVGDVSLATITVYGDANLISKGGAFNTGTLGANKNVQIEVKIPGDSGWLDLARPASLSEDITADGSGGFNGGGGDVNQTIDTDGTGYGINFRTATLEGTSGGNADYLVVRITAHKDWTGYLSRISFTYGS